MLRGEWASSVSAMPTGSGTTQAPVTIYDVAQACGVAASTVSRAFSRPGRVNAETAARIRQVAEDMGYRTTPIARPIPATHTSVIGFLASDLTNPFFFGLIRGAEQAATASGYTMLLSDIQESAENERDILERMIPLVDGVILASSRMSDSAIRVVAKQVPTVLLNRIVTDVPSMVTDNARGMKLAVEHLAGLGHTDITYLAGPEASWADGVRWRSMRDAAFQLDVRTHWLGPFAPTLAGGRAAALELAKHPTSAAIAYNDLMAIGLMQGIQRLGGRVPEDVSVVGFDNIFGADLCTPGLTTVASPLRDLGSNAVNAIVGQFATRLHRPTDVKPLLLPAALRTRESTTEFKRRRVRWGVPSPH